MSTLTLTPSVAARVLISAWSDGGSLTSTRAGLGIDADDRLDGHEVLPRLAGRAPVAQARDDDSPVLRQREAGLLPAMKPAVGISEADLDHALMIARAIA